MALVAYSDSESESEATVTKPVSARSTTQDNAASKTGFQKVINRAEPNKIKVNLASLSQTTKTNEEDDLAKERPAKRAKFGGLFSDFNALLPAPKNPTRIANGGVPSNSTRQAEAKTSGPGSGFSLKTGAEPTFQRHQAAVEDELEDDLVARGEVLSHSKPVEEEVKAVGKKPMFKPLSVSRNQKKKPSIAQNMPTATQSKAPNTKAPTKTTNTAQAPLESKRSLFAVPDEVVPIKASESSTDYQPMFTQEGNTEDWGDASSVSIEQDYNAQASKNQGQSLEQLADSMQLSASERRQLFGRRGKPTDAQVAQFSLAAEYAHNREMLEMQDTAPQHNPVKSIAPGKHSLQQLMNAATHNKDALEESFARGKSNKKEAGTKYGW